MLGDIPMLHVLVDNHFPFNEIAVLSAEHFEMLAVTNQLNAKIDSRIGQLPIVHLNIASSAVAVVRVMRDCIEDSVRVRGVDDFLVEGAWKKGP
jgi:hypothetical protein